VKKPNLIRCTRIDCGETYIRESFRKLIQLGVLPTDDGRKNDLRLCRCGSLIYAPAAGRRIVNRVNRRD
jgi:hypothetical protein